MVAAAGCAVDDGWCCLEVKFNWVQKLLFPAQKLLFDLQLTIVREKLLLGLTFRGLFSLTRFFDHLTRYTFFLSLSSGIYWDLLHC